MKRIPKDKPVLEEEFKGKMSNLGKLIKKLIGKTKPPNV